MHDVQTSCVAATATGTHETVMHMDVDTMEHPGVYSKIIYSTKVCIMRSREHPDQHICDIIEYPGQINENYSVPRPV